MTVPANYRGALANLMARLEPLPVSMGHGSEFRVVDPEGAPAADGRNYHAAKDWFAPGGTPVRAPIDGAVVEAYGVWVQKKLYGREYMGIERATFLIGPDGKIARVWRRVKVAGHVADVLAAAKA